MLTVKTPEEACRMIQEAFPPAAKKEYVPLSEAFGRVLFEDIIGAEYVPGFDRSTVDGYAVRAKDTFGCSDALPAILTLQGEVRMGDRPDAVLQPGCCVAVPTGGAVPAGADAAIMLEYAEVYGDGTIGICKSAAPGDNMIFKGDDLCPGKIVLPKGRRLAAQDIGALAAMGCAEVPVCAKLRVGILSTGNELVPVSERPKCGQVRDVNSAMLAAAMQQFGTEARSYGIIRDEEALLHAALQTALEECDVVLISGGSSVGMKDATCRVIEQQGSVLFHGIAMKPGKPTIFGKVGGKPVVGLPGHPVAAFFVTQVFVGFLLAELNGRSLRQYTFPAILTEAVEANHGRTQYNGAVLREKNGTWYAEPIHGKSGLITSLAGSDGYFVVPRDCEGIAAGTTVKIMRYTAD